VSGQVSTGESKKMTEKSKSKGRRITRLGTLIGLAALLMCAFGAGSAQAAAPAFTIKATWGDTNLPPGGEGQFLLMVRNAGDANGTGPMTITNQLPAGVIAKEIGFKSGDEGLASDCSGIGTETVTCSFLAQEPQVRAQALGNTGVVKLEPTSYLPPIFVDVEVSPTASGTGTNLATVSGGGSAAPHTDIDPVSFSNTPSSFGLVPGSFAADVFDAEYPFGEPERQAGAHPFEQRVDLDFNVESDVFVDEDRRYTRPVERIKDVEVTLPRGFIGNPESLPKCDPEDFAERGITLNSTQCPPNTQVGFINVYLANGIETFGYSTYDQIHHVPIYSLEPPRGQAADFAFNATDFIRAHIYPTLDPAQNYAIKTISPDISTFVPIRAAEVTFWGVPADPVHDRFRYFTGGTGDEPKAGAPFTAPIKPLLANPVDCGFDNGGARIRIDSYSNPGNYTPVEEHEDALNVEGCDDPRFRFKPDVELQPTSRAAGGPTGLDVHLQVEQRDDEVSKASDLYADNGDVRAIPSPPMKKAIVTFPEGMTVSPSAAQGLGYCTPEQIGLGTDRAVKCPDNSQYGTLTLHTPILPVNDQPEGFIYIAQQNNNPFHNFLSLYLVIQEPDRGILVKVPGRVDLDPVTGQITTTFDDLPQFPVEDMELNLKGGLRAGLVNPQTCGRKTIRAEFFSWHDPSTPHVVNNFYEVTQNPDGSPCFNSLADRPFNAEVSGGTRNNLAGSFSPLELSMKRGDIEQEIAGVEGKAPPGLLASLRGVGRCTDAAIAAAANPERTGTEELTNPSCPASSQVGTVDAGAGVGQVLTYVKGKIYMAGPYKGAPLSGVAIVPAVAGPFDLGTIVTRAPAYPDPRTAEIKLVTDPLPLIFKGVPVRVRDIQVHLDRPSFTLNPTNCEPMSLTGTLFSSEGKSKSTSNPFQAADCAFLGFKPKLTARLIGGTKRGAHPKFRATFRAREGDANVKQAVVALPRSAFLDQAHIRTICTRVQFRADACPRASIYGRAVAKTPLLDEPLKGPVYLRSSDNKLPDMVADLNGEIPVEVVGRIDSVKGGGIRANFEAVPDAPVESFTINMQGGKKGLIQNSRNLCKRTYRLNAQFDAQNGKSLTLRPPLKAACKQQRKAKRAGR